MSDTIVYDGEIAEQTDEQWENEPVQVGVDFDTNGDAVIATIPDKVKKAKKGKALAVKQFTKAEAEEKTQEVIATGRALRSGLLELHDRGAHKAFGYAGFPEYAQDRLGITLKERQLKNTLQAARVDRVVEAENPLPFAVTAALGVLSDDPAKVKQAYTEYQEWQGKDTRTPAEQITGLKRIVRQLMPEDKKAKKEGKQVIDTKFEPVKDEPGMLPIVDLHAPEETATAAEAPDFVQAAHMLDTVKGWLYDPSTIDKSLRVSFGEGLMQIAQWVLTGE